ncbi:Hypothetical Protein FCC1311_031332 [Hondaea fermentalgiana]|uniref:VWFA domain-containing protein n=1 Tax=Hondaea fermentalgiana TaxID=2315210 RepID=A0A2R5G7D6_9STRA|nr:Hypothetical Protein FCC1311_031332 [Hondaea fermentalgiana]|eukprot:GBG26910.1 Hypothetical Protein FCC1311_031332 [Hondaea fermentalgiana]
MLAARRRRGRSLAVTAGLVLAALVQLAAPTSVAAAPVTSYQAVAGQNWTGFCSDKNFNTLPFYSKEVVSYEGAQQGFDICYATFGSKFIGFSWYAKQTYAVACYFDPQDIPALPDGWASGRYDGEAEAPIAGAWFEPGVTCYSIRAVSNCSARVVAAVDRTFAAANSSAAIALAQSAYGLAGSVVSALPIGKNVSMGLVDLDRKSIHWRVKLDTLISEEKAKLVDKVTQAQSSLDASSWSSNTRFQPLLKGVSNKLASDSNIPSYLLLVSDGLLHDAESWVNLSNLKQGMIRRLGDTAPQILCLQMSGAETTPYFEAVCDKIFYEGVTEDLVAAIASTICNA